MTMIEVVQGEFVAALRNRLGTDNSHSSCVIDPAMLLLLAMKSCRRDEQGECQRRRTGKQQTPMPVKSRMLTAAINARVFGRCSQYNHITPSCTEQTP